MARTVKHRGQFWRADTIQGDASWGLRLFAEWPAGMSKQQAIAAQNKVTDLLVKLELAATRPN